MFRFGERQWTSRADYEREKDEFAHVMRAETKCTLEEGKRVFDALAKFPPLLFPEKAPGQPKQLIPDPKHPLTEEERQYYFAVAAETVMEMRNESHAQESLVTIEQATGAARKPKKPE